MALGRPRADAPIPDAAESTLTIAANGLEFGAVAAGPAMGRLVLLLHGFPEFSYGWRHQIGPLAAAGLRVVAPDQRGYHRSSKPARVGDYRLDLLADDVLGIATALGHHRFSVVGHDWGAAVAWTLAQQCPDRIERAVVLNGPHPDTVWQHTLWSPSQALKGWYVGFFQLPLLPESVLRANDFWALRTTLQSTSRPGTFDEAELERYRAAWREPGALEAMLNWYRALARTPRVPHTRPIDVPMRVLWGDADAFIDRGLAEAAAALCSDVDVIHLPDATHWLHHEEPRRVSELIVEFLAR